MKSRQVDETKRPTVEQLYQRVHHQEAPELRGSKEQRSSTRCPTCGNTETNFGRNSANSNASGEGSVSGGGTERQRAMLRKKEEELVRREMELKKKVAEVSSERDQLVSS